MKTATDALNKLAQHDDPEVRAAAVLIREDRALRSRVVSLVRNALAQVRTDVKYLAFDLQCTRQERDEARAAL